MKILINNFLLLGCFILQPLAATAGVGRTDNREYVEWNQEPYNKIVHLLTVCTGQYVAPNLILTNAHCVYNKCYDSELDGMPECTFTNSAGQHGTARVIAVGEPYSINMGREFNDKRYYTPDTDWALLETDLISDSIFNVQPNMINGHYDLAGFGGMRIISDEELPIIRKKYAAFMKSLLNIDKASDKAILKHTMLPVDSDVWRNFDAMLVSDNDNTGVSIAPIFSQDERFKLKVHRNCRISDIGAGYFSHECDTFHGNSGGAFFRDNNLYGITATGVDSFAEKKLKGHGADSSVFYDTVIKAIDTH